MRKRFDITGFRAPRRHPLGDERRTVMLAELVATVALALSTVVAATALTVRIAHADVVDGVLGHEGSLFGLALLLGLLFIGIGSFLPGIRKR